jgi:hypothetical protein
MASLAAFISNAIEKVSTDPIYLDMEFETREEARIDFTNALLFELGLGPKPEAKKKAEAPKAEEKPKKKRASKKAQETVVAEAAVAILEQVKEAPKEVEALTEAMKALTVEEPKAKKARKTKAAEPAPEPHFGIGAGAPPPAAEKASVATKEKKKPGPKPKAKPEGGASNIEKLTPTHKKHIKAIAAELKVEAKEKEFLAYANEMTAEAWGAKPLDDHIREFLAPEEAETLAPPPTTFLQVEFDGVDYLVDPASCFVYAMNDSGSIKARDHIGVVGMGKFKDMELPEEDE